MSEHTDIISSIPGRGAAAVPNGYVEADTPETGGIAADRLRSLIERIERLEEERKALSSDIKDIYAEAKGAGFDPKIMKTIIRLRKQDQKDVEEQETLLDVYKRALGM